MSLIASAVIPVHTYHGMTLTQVKALKEKKRRAYNLGPRTFHFYVIEGGTVISTGSRPMTKHLLAAIKNSIIHEEVWVSKAGPTLTVVR